MGAEAGNRGAGEASCPLGSIHIHTWEPAPVAAAPVRPVTLCDMSVPGAVPGASYASSSPIMGLPRAGAAPYLLVVQRT